MYKRDFGILLLSVFAVYFSLQHEGNFTFRKSWYHLLASDQATLGAADSLAAPVVADLNGDGRSEVIVATHTGRVQVLSLQPAGRKGEGFAQAQVIAEVSLLPAGPNQAATGWRAVALATGFIDPPARESDRILRKQVLLVVTAHWQVLCYDHNLQQLWSTQVKGEVPEHALKHAAVREVALHISSQGVREGDRGRVIVAGSMQLGEIASNGAAEDAEDEDPLLHELRAEQEHYEMTRSRQRNEALDSGDDMLKGMQRARHFSFYALDGGSGDARWTHEGADFHRDLHGLAEQVVPQHHLRLDAQSLSNVHFGEASCRDFRDSVLRALPHRWVHRGDTRLRVTHFKRQKRGKGARKGEHSSAGEGRSSTHASIAHHEDTVVYKGGSPGGHHGVDHQNPVAAAVAKVAEKAAKGAGLGSSRYPPGSRGSQQEPAAAKVEPPNALVAYREEGLEAVDISTGQTICQLHLPAGGLHADLDADGVPDHVQAVGTRNHEQQSATGHAHAHQCWASALSGIPAREPLFNGSICRPASLALFQSALARSRSLAGAVKVVPPVFLPVRGEKGHYHHGLGMAVFLNSRGEVTAYHPTGDQAWQVATSATWYSQGYSSGLQASAHKPQASLTPLALRTGQVPTAVLAAGSYSAVLLSEHGHLLDKLTLPAAPELPLLVVDFNGDHAADIVLVSHGGIFGYEQVRHPGGLPFSMLVACLIAAMAVVYITQQAAIVRPGRPKKGRSTERVD